MWHVKHYTCFNRFNYILYAHRPRRHVINVAICLLFCIEHYGCIPAGSYGHSVWPATYWLFHAYAPSWEVIRTIRAFSGHTNTIRKYKITIHLISYIYIMSLFSVFFFLLLLWSNVVMLNTCQHPLQSERKDEVPQKAWSWLREHKKLVMESWILRSQTCLIQQWGQISGCLWMRWSNRWECIHHLMSRSGQKYHRRQKITLFQVCW